MIKLHVVQAENGDCFILESNQGKDKVTVLIDGGPYQTFEKHLKPTLHKLPLNGKLDLVVLSHIDNDHIVGLLDLFDEIKSQTQNGKKELIRVGKLWHNSFNDLFQLDMEPKKFFSSFLSNNAIANKEQEKKEKIIASIIMRGFQQGNDLTQLAKSLKIQINPEFNKLIVVKNFFQSIKLNNIKIHILGPTKENLEKLGVEWKKWLNKKKITQISQYELLQILDKSIPNLASIMFLVEIKYRKILFTGDGLGGDIVRILSRNAMLDKKGKFHVDVLKVPHHGSDRNVTREFFDTVLADYYVISANGMYDNPSLSTLKWIIQRERYDDREIKIIATNETPVISRILSEYEPKKYNYKFVILKNMHYFTIKLLE